MKFPQQLESSKTEMIEVLMKLHGMLDTYEAALAQYRAKLQELIP